MRSGKDLLSELDTSDKRVAAIYAYMILIQKLKNQKQSETIRQGADHFWKQLFNLILLQKYNDIDELIARISQENLVTHLHRFFPNPTEEEKKFLSGINTFKPGQVTPELPLRSTILNDITNLYIQGIQKSINAIEDFATWRDNTYKHLTTDVIHTSHKDEKSKSYKITRSNQYHAQLEILKDESKSSLEKANAYIKLAEWTHRDIEKSSSTRSKFVATLRNNIQPLLQNVQEEIKKNKAAKQDTDCIRVLNTFKEIGYIHPRKEFAKPLQEYLETITLNSSPDTHYFVNSGRLFKNYISPYKKDMLVLFIKGILQDIKNGDINNRYFENAKNTLANINKNNPQLMKLLEDMSERYKIYTTKMNNEFVVENICGFTLSNTNAGPSNPADAKLEAKQEFIKTHIFNQLHAYILAQIVGSTQLFSENKKEYGQIANFIASFDLLALNIVAPGISILQAVIVSGLNRVDTMQRADDRNKATSIASGQSIENLDKIASEFARLVSYRFAYQIQCLYYSNSYTETLQKLVNYAVLYALANLHEGFIEKLKNTQSSENVAAVLLESMLAPTVRFPGLDSCILFDSKKLDHLEDSTVMKGQKWTVDDLFQKTGYVVADNGVLTFYKPSGTEPAKYGYAFLTEEEAANKYNLQGYKIVKESAETIEKYNKLILQSLTRTQEMVLPESSVRSFI